MINRPRPARIATSLASLVILLASGPRSLDAQELPTIFSRLSGEWCGQGTLMGRAAAFAMSWRSEHGFAVLSFSNAFTGADGLTTPVLQAVATYRTSPATPEAVWLDSRGVRIEIRWEASDSTLVSNWTAPTEQGRTSYRVRSATEIEVTDEVRSDGVLRSFASAHYSRAAGECPSR